METLTLTVNSTEEELRIDPGRYLSDILRNELGYTGTKRGCDTAACGACTVLLDDDPVKACNVLAIQAADQDVTTVEGLEADGTLSPAQKAFWENYSFQCGFCTPGFLMTTTAFIEENDDPGHEEISEYLAGNLCRCTGYTKIVDGVQEAARIKRERGQEQGDES